MTDLTPDEQKQLVKEAIKEWMDDKARDFGWWGLKKLGIMAGLFLLLWYIQWRGYTFP
jgi:hypothetical protein